MQRKGCTATQRLRSAPDAHALHEALPQSVHTWHAACVGRTTQHWRGTRMTIEPLLTRPVSALSSKATCAEAARRMRRQNIGSIVIEQDGAPIGIVTDRDLTVRLVAEELDPTTVTVDRVMSPFPVFLTPQRDLRAALDVMVEMSVRRLPAVNAKGRVVGIVSLDDILIELAAQLGKVQQLLQTERGATSEDDLIPD